MKTFSLIFATAALTIGVTALLTQPSLLAQPVPLPNEMNERDPHLIYEGQIASMEYIAAGAMAAGVSNQWGKVYDGWVLLDDMRMIPRDKIVELRFRADGGRGRFDDRRRDDRRRDEQRDGEEGFGPPANGGFPAEPQPTTPIRPFQSNN